MPRARMKIEDDDEVEAEVEERGEDDRGRDHQPRELSLADHPLLGDDRGDRVRRRFLEEGEEDDPEQQQDRIFGSLSLPTLKTWVKTKSRTANSISGRTRDQT